MSLKINKEIILGDDENQIVLYPINSGGKKGLKIKVGDETLELVVLNTSNSFTTESSDVSKVEFDNLDNDIINLTIRHANNEEYTYKMKKVNANPLHDPSWSLNHNNGLKLVGLYNEHDVQEHIEQNIIFLMNSTREYATFFRMSSDYTYLYYAEEYFTLISDA